MYLRFQICKYLWDLLTDPFTRHFNRNKARGSARTLSCQRLRDRQALCKQENTYTHDAPGVRSNRSGMYLLRQQLARKRLGRQS